MSSSAHRSPLRQLLLPARSPGGWTPDVEPGAFVLPEPHQATHPANAPRITVCTMITYSPMMMLVMVAHHRQREPGRGERRQDRQDAGGRRQDEAERSEHLGGAGDPQQDDRGLLEPTLPGRPWTRTA